jgi:dienelactone hydrolase
LVAAALAVIATLTPASAPAGFSLYKADETKTTFTSGGQKIEVWQFTPKEGTGPFPGVVLLHGIDGLDDLITNKNIQLLYRILAGKIAEKGFVVHFVHYFQRTPINAKDVDQLKKDLKNNLLDKSKKPDEKLEKLYRAWMETVQHAVKNLRETKDVDKDHIGLVGLSMGGFVATSVAVEDPGLGIAALANVFGGLPPQHCEQVRKAGKPKLPPILIMGGEDDKIVPEQVQRELFELWRSAGGRGEAHFYGDVGHAFYDAKRDAIDQDLALNEALPVAIRFLRRHLQVKAPEKK